MDSQKSRRELCNPLNTLTLRPWISRSSVSHILRDDERSWVSLTLQEVGVGRNVRAGSGHDLMAFLQGPCSWHGVVEAKPLKGL